jgi:hypothetical protein
MLLDLSLSLNSMLLHQPPADDGEGEGEGEDPPPEEEEPNNESIFGFERPESAPTSFPGLLIPEDEQDGDPATRWARQNNDAALSISAGNMACNGSNASARFIGYTPVSDLENGHIISVIPKIEATSGNMAVTTSNGGSSTTSNTRLGWKQGTRVLTAGGQISLRVQFNAGVTGNFSRLKAYDVSALLEQKWFIVMCAGQSNLIGATAVADPDSDTPVEGCVVIPASNNAYVGAVAGQPMIAVDPITHQTLNGSAQAYGGGPCGSFLRELRKIIPADYTIVLSATSYAGAGFKEGDLWNKGSATKTAYDGFWTANRAVWAAAPEGSVVGCLLFCGGESDLGSGNMAEWSDPDTGAIAFFNEVRAEPGWGEVPFVIAEIGMDPGTTPNVQAMIDLQKKLATGSGDALEFSRCVYVPRPDEWTLTDGTHFDQATHRQRGADWAAALETLIYPT